VIDTPGFRVVEPDHAAGDAARALDFAAAELFFECGYSEVGWYVASFFRLSRPVFRNVARGTAGASAAQAGQLPCAALDIVAAGLAVVYIFAVGS